MRVVLPFAAISVLWAQQGTELPQAYLDAVKEAARVDARNISRNLIAITPFEKGLIWRRDPGGKAFVKVASWIAQESSPYHVGPMKAPAGYDDDTLIWVTAVPQLKSFCADYQQMSGKNLVLRIEQVLGIPPLKVSSTNVVEFWVSPSDLLRPTPDPEVSDHEAELDFPESSELVSISQDYKEWFLRHRSTVYTRPVPGTWTRLGYTYDWATPENPVGLSEFIIRPDSNIEVAGIFQTTAYCH